MAAMALGVGLGLSGAIAACSASDRSTPSDCTDPGGCGVPNTPDTGTLPDGGTAPPVTTLAITLSPSPLTAVPGDAIDVGVTIARPASVIEALTLSVSNLPANASVVAPTISAGSTQASFRLSLGTTTPQGMSNIVVTVKSTSPTGPSASATLPLTIIGRPGDIDTTFGTNAGHSPATTAFNLSGMGVQGDGHIVLGGSGGAGPDFVATRFDANGVPDTKFGTSGLATVAFGSAASSTQTIVQADGKIAMAGYVATTVPMSTARLMALARINADGSLDTGFGGAGNARLTLTPGPDNLLYNLTQQKDGKLVATGISSGTVDFNLAVVRLNPQGTPDGSFGAGGISVFDTGAQDFGFGSAIDDQGRIFTVGQRANAQMGWNVLTERLTAAGAVDTTYGPPNGWLQVVNGMAGQAFGWAVLIQPDGRIVIGGASPNSVWDFLLMRLNVDGSLDTTFGTSGVTIMNVGAYDRVFRLALDAQNRIVFAGQSGNDVSSVGVVGRLLANGAPDTTFGSGGRALLDISPSGGDFVQGLAIQADGRILVAGTSTGPVAWVARLWN